MLINRIKNFFKIDSKYNVAIMSILLTSIVCFVSYNAFIVYGFNSPDGILEGFHYYTNRHWAIGACGRWFLAIINNAHANLVIPWLTIIECCIVNWISSFTICKILKIKSKWSISLLSIFFAVIPTFIEINLYTNSSFSYSISVLLSAMYVYFNLKRDYLYSIISAFCLGFAMGSYQSQIGIAIGLAVMSLIKMTLEDEKDINKYILRLLISGLGGLIVYVIGLNVSLSIYGLELQSRAAQFSITKMLQSLPNSFFKTYLVFFNTFKQTILKRQYFYFVLLIILIIELICIVINIIKDKEYKKIISILLVFILPVAFNFIIIILPMFETTVLMLTPNFLIIFLLFYFLTYISIDINLILKPITCLVVIIISWTYILSANATYDSYKLSYNLYNKQFSSALEKVYQLNGYEHNKTNIVVVGVPDDSILKENIRTYNYALNLYDNLLYWEVPSTDINTTYYYLLNEFGVYSGIITEDEYLKIANDADVLSMPSWPNKDSVQMVKGYAIIKFGDLNE